MKFISDPKELKKTLKRLINSYQNYYWAVAWASSSDVSDLLYEKRERIRKIVIGTHFYQTDPEVIDKFFGVKEVKFNIDTGELFHPKIYYFENNPNDWSCLIGSANFTNAALGSNTELCVLFDSSDSENQISKEIKEKIGDYYNAAIHFDEGKLSQYKEWRKRNAKKFIKKLSGKYSNSETPQVQTVHPLACEIFTMSWAEFIGKVKGDPHHSYEGRIKLLEFSREKFKRLKRFEEIDSEARKIIAGYWSDGEHIGGWFGSMSGAGYFKQFVNNNHPSISKSLDCIPMEGDVSKEDYLGFCDLYQSLKGCGFSGATRLLSMKRPDLFICLNSKNKPLLRADFKIKSDIHLENYWEEVIERIKDSAWWNETEPSDPVEASIWNGRTAFLDAIYYDP
jgi:HKD family nuclease